MERMYSSSSSSTYLGAGHMGSSLSNKAQTLISPGTSSSLAKWQPRLSMSAERYNLFIVSFPGACYQLDMREAPPLGGS